MDGLTTVEQSRLEQCEQVIERGLKTFTDVGNALLEIRDSKLYRQEWGTFEEYCRERWGIKRQRAYELMDAAGVVSNLSEISDILPARESHAAPLAQLELEQQREVWQKVIEKDPNKITAEVVRQFVDEYRPTFENKPHVANNSGENEWYTPSPIIEAARRVMGSIDTDPASSDLANETVRAGIYFTQDNDGLVKTWSGNVWMNPPYAQPLMSQFASAVSDKFADREIEQACVLVNNATETVWFQQMLDVCSAVCFLRGRVKFIDKAGNPSGAPLQGQAVLYFGNHADKFTAEFYKLGKVLYV